MALRQTLHSKFLVVTVSVAVAVLAACGVNPVTHKKEIQFVSEAQTAGMVGLAGHRSVGGIRASIYNAVSTEACQTLASFMNDFAARNG